MKKEKTIQIVLIAFVAFIFIIIAVTKDKGEEVKEYEGELGFELHVDSNFKKEDYLSMGYPTMFDLGGADCVPCKMMAPELKALNEELMGKAIIKFVDYWKYPHLAKQFSFAVIPTQFFYDTDGKLIKKHEGGITKDEMLAIFSEMGYDFNE